MLVFPWCKLPTPFIRAYVLTRQGVFALSALTQGLNTTMRSIFIACD